MCKKIIINFPTNIGDTIMSLPVLDRLNAAYPQSKITAIASSKTEGFLLQNKAIHEVVIFDKSWSAKRKIKFTLSLIGGYDMVIDLKNSFLPVVLGARKRTPFLRKFPGSLHAKDRFLMLVKGLTADKCCPPGDFSLSDNEKERWGKLKLPPSVFLACSSHFSGKAYPYDYLKNVVERLREEGFPLVILGEKGERAFYGGILSLGGVVDLVGKTKISDVAYLLKNFARLLLCVDSSILHLGSYYNIPIVAIFGPTDPRRYGPWSERQAVLQNAAAPCLSCQKTRCAFNYPCIKAEPEAVVRSVKEVLAAEETKNRQ